MTECPDDISVSVTCNNIGRILQELGKLNEAVHYYQRALKPEYGDISQIRASKFCQARFSRSGTDCHPSSVNLYSTVWYNLGLIYDKLGSYSDAISAFEMSLELRKAMLGSDHPDIACLLYNIGVLQMEQQQLLEASSSFRDALRIRRGGAAGQLNDKHIVKTLEKLSSLHKAKGNIQGAIDASREVLSIQEASADYDDVSRKRDTGVTLRSIAELHHALGEMDSAVKLSLESVQKLESVHKYNMAAPLVDCMDRVSALEHLVTSLLLVGSLYHEVCEPLRAFDVLQQAASLIHNIGIRTDSLASLSALREVTSMLATTYCAAEA